MPRVRTRREGPMLLGVAMGKSDAQSFLRRLATDDRFRARLQRDPAGVLARAGVMIPAEALPARVFLPAKDDVREFLASGRPMPLPGPSYDACRMWAVLYAIAGQAK